MLANPSTNYGTGCNAQLSSDSWIPSNNQDTTKSTYIACVGGFSDVGDKTTCTSTLTNNGGNTCAGCMDSTLLMDYYPNVGDSATLTTDLNSRYLSGGSCAFNTQLHNIWTHYYQKKNSKLGPGDTAGTTTVLARAEQSVLDINGTGAGTVITAINTIHDQLYNVQSSISSISTITDPDYGMLAGLNCKVFGEDFQRFQKVICGKFYNNLYNLRLTIGISAFGILFSLCCIVCTGVRHFKHMERLNKVGDAFFKAKDDS